MAVNSHIEWTEATWNPVTGCMKVSAGCKNCYAERLALRLQAMGNPRYRNGFMVTLHEDLIELPKRWREPRLIFVNSMSDLFHEQVPLEFIQRVFATMRECSQHTFQILTKRSARLRKLARDLDWPANVWMGVSVEDSRVLSRVDDLTKGSSRYSLSFVRAAYWLPRGDRFNGYSLGDCRRRIGLERSPMKIEWIREIFRACRKQRTKFFFKQWGGVRKHTTGRLLRGRTYDEMPTRVAA